jgi:hypothetical protein
MSDRITLTQPIYMPLLGQWVIVYGGSTIDVPSASAFSPGHITAVSVGGGSTLINGKATPVSNVRTKMPIRKPPKISARQRKQAEAAQAPRMYLGPRQALYGYAGDKPPRQPTLPKKGR